MVWRSGRSDATDLRSRVLAAIDGGSAAKVVASLFRVSVSCIYKALARRRETGETAARPQRDRQRLKLALHHEAITAEVARRPDVTLDELRAWLLETNKVTASPVGFADIPPGDRWAMGSCTRRWPGSG
jgi:transposase